MAMLSTNDEEKPKEDKKSESHKSNGLVEETKNVSTHDELVMEFRGKLEKGSKPSELATFAKSLAGSSQEVMDVLFEALFDGTGKGFAKQVAKKKNYITATVQEEEAQMLLLHAIETFCCKCSRDAVKVISVAAKALYDGDMLKEEFIVQWYQKGIIVRPFMEWLQNAESEEE